jgi:hypothetical protein
VPWRFGRRASEGPGARREFTQSAEPQPPRYRSPALNALLSRLSDEGAYNILDLGAASGANIEFFSRFSCRFQIVDLPDALASEKVRSMLDTDPAAAFRRILPVDRDPFDVVLAWDVFNYLTRDQLRCLASDLAWLSRPGALMLAFISTAKEMPAQAGDFRIADERTILWRPRTTEMQPSPKLPPADVERLIAGFAVVHSVLMRHGIREYLFERRSDAGGAAR